MTLTPPKTVHLLVFRCVSDHKDRFAAFETHETAVSFAQVVGATFFNVHRLRVFA